MGLLVPYAIDFLRKREYNKFIVLKDVSSIDQQKKYPDRRLHLEVHASVCASGISG